MGWWTILVLAWVVGIPVVLAVAAAVGATVGRRRAMVHARSGAAPRTREAVATVPATALRGRTRAG